MHPISIVEASIADLRGALEAGTVTSVELVHEYLRRIAHYDRSGPRLNAIPILDPGAFAAARASDERRAAGRLLGPLDGIPYTAKDSYLATGLTAASGSPAFAGVVAQGDAFAIERLRAGGAVLLGLTNMPPMANGGMQRGVYGRAESPYNPAYLAAAYVSGSSNGSGVSTTCSMAAFGLGEETWSSGRAPASNNALVAYTPSRGVISTRGNWPLTPTMDVVVPHTRSVADLLEILDLLVVDDPETRGDLWRRQKWIRLPRPSELRPADFQQLHDPDALRGRRLGIPRMYINQDPETTNPIETHPDVIALWDAARAALEQLGAEVVEVDFPAVSRYERDRPGIPSLVERGILPAGYLREEVHELTAWAFNDFLAANGDPQLSRLQDAVGAQIYPMPAGTIPDRLGIYDRVYDLDMSLYVELARTGLPEDLGGFAHLEAGLRGLERAREEDLEAWLDDLGLDALVFPAAADVGREDAERDPEAHAHSFRNGVGVSNGNLVPRHYGIPTVTVPMGRMATHGMPVGLTFAGRAYDDWRLIGFASAYEHGTQLRRPPERCPALPALTPKRSPGGNVPAPQPGTPAAQDPAPPATPGRAAEDLTVTITTEAMAQSSTRCADRDAGSAELERTYRVSIDTNGTEVVATLNGDELPLSYRDGTWVASVTIPAAQDLPLHSEWRGPYGALLTAVASLGGSAQVGACRAVGGLI